VMSLNDSVLFDAQTEPVRFDLPGADVTLFLYFFGAEESEALLRELLNNTHWRQDFITICGRQVRLPRLTAWYGDAGRPYTYSGITMRPEQWTPTLLAVKERIEPVSGVTFTSVLLNLYRDGADSVSWHQDDEPELGEQPVIGSVSLGQTRRFQMRHKQRKDIETVNINLENGSYLLMKGSTQRLWKHQLAKSSAPMGARVNLTFRVIA
jgi:alkylated DNA repair dioxygenase AlkB